MFLIFVRNSFSKNAIFYSPIRDFGAFSKGPIKVYTFYNFICEYFSKILAFS